MGKTIHTLAYMVTADTRSFTQGMVLTKNELKATKQVLEATRGPIRQFAGELGGLNTIRAKGSISNMQYLSSVNQLIAGHTSGIPVLGRFTSVLSLGNPLMIAGATSVMAMAAGVGVLVGAVAYATIQIKSQLKAIDDLIASASTIGIATKSFQAMGHAAGLADIEIGAMSKGVETMLGNVSKAAQGGADSKLGKVFGIINLDAQKLKSLNPEEQLKKITAALDNTANANDRIRAAKSIFGDADFLRLDTSHLERATTLIDDLGGGLSDLDVSKFNLMDDSVKDMNLSISMTWQKIAMALTPAIKEAADEVADLVIGFNKLHLKAKDLQDVEDAALAVVTAMKKINQELKESDSFQGPLVQMFKDWGKELSTWGRLLRTFRQALPSKNDAVGTTGTGTKGGSRDGGSDASSHSLAKVFTISEAQDELDAMAKMDSAKYVQKLENIADTFQKLSDTGNQLTISLKHQAATFGMTARQADIFQAAQSGASIANLVAAAALDKELTALEEKKKLEDKMTSDLESARTGKEVFRDEATALKKALASDIISQSEFDKLLGKAAEGLPSNATPGGAAAMMQGSSEAESFLANEKARQMGAKDRQAEIVDVLRSIDKHVADDKAASVPKVIGTLRGS